MVDEGMENFLNSFTEEELELFLPKNSNNNYQTENNITSNEIKITKKEIPKKKYITDQEQNILARYNLIINNLKNKINS